MWSAVRRRSYPPDSSYKYNPIEKHGCNGTKVDCPECEGMEGLSRYTYNASSTGSTAAKGDFVAAQVQCDVLRRTLACASRRSGGAEAVYAAPCRLR